MIARQTVDRFSRHPIATLIAACLLFMASVIAGLTFAPLNTVDVGNPEQAASLVDFHAIELQEEAGGYTPFRWTDASSSVIFRGPALNQRYQIVLRLAAGPRPAGAPAPVVNAFANGVQLQPLTAAPDFQIFRLDLPAGAMGLAPDLNVELKTPTFVPPGSADSRELGVMVNWARLRPVGAPVGGLAIPSPYYLLAWGLNGLLLAAIARRTPFGKSSRRLWPALIVLSVALALSFQFARPLILSLSWALVAMLAAGYVAVCQIGLWIEEQHAGRGFTCETLHTLGIGNPRLRRSIEAAICIVLAGYFLFAIVLPFQNRGLGDLLTYYSGAWLATHGGDPYDFAQIQNAARVLHLSSKGTQTQVYPPSATVLLSPLLLVSPSQVRIVWLIINFIALLGGAAFLYLALRQASPKPLSPVVLMALLTLSRAMNRTLSLGQIGVLIFFLFALGLWALTRRNAALTGISITLAAAIKVIPGIFVLYLLWKRQWRGVVAGAVTGGALLLLSAFFGGVTGWVTWFTRALPATSEISAYRYNQSLIAFVKRFIVPDEGEPAFNRRLQVSADPSDLALRLVSYAIVLSFLILLAWWLRGDRDKGALVRQLEYAAVLAVMLIIAPLAWDFYGLWLLLSMAVVLNALTVRRLALASELALSAAVFGGWLLMQREIGDFYQGPATPILLMSLYFYATLLIAGALFFLIRQGKLASAVQPVESLGAGQTLAASEGGGTIP